MNYEKEIPIYGSAQYVDIVNMGYNYDWLQNLFLSSYDVEFPSLTSINRHTTIRRVSAICPAFEGFLLPLSTYNVIDRNTLRINLSTISFQNKGYIDVIFENVAGYTKLTDINHILNFGIDSDSYYNSYDVVTPTAATSVTFVTESSIDSDNDGYSDSIESLFGTDPNDPNEFPVSIFNVYNNI